MFGRRTHQRFTFPVRVAGTLRIIRDVLIDRMDGDSLTVISRRVGVIGEQLTIELSERGGHPLEVRVVESRPAMRDGVVKHRVKLELCNLVQSTGATAVEQQPGIPLGQQTAVSLGTLTQQIPVQIVNCSSSGCLLESHSAVEVGTVASLRAQIDGHDCVDDLHIVRRRSIEGSSLYHCGAEFLWVSAPQQHSLRLAIRCRSEELAVGGDKGQVFRAEGD